MGVTMTAGRLPTRAAQSAPCSACQPSLSRMTSSASGQGAWAAGAASHDQPGWSLRTIRLIANASRDGKLTSTSFIPEAKSKRPGRRHPVRQRRPWRVRDVAARRSVRQPALAHLGQREQHVVERMNRDAALLGPRAGVDGGCQGRDPHVLAQRPGCGTPCA